VSTAPPVVAAAAPAKTTYVEGFEIVRVLSAFNVVTFHVLAISNGLVGRGSVAAFVMIAGALPAMRPDLGPFRGYAWRRAERILFPWLVWSAVYGAIAGLRMLSGGHEVPWTAHWLAIGTAIHLWFFVFAFAASLVVWWLLRLLHHMAPQRAAVLLFAFAAPLIVLEPQLAEWLEPPSPFGLWLLCAPALLIGVGLGMACRAASRRIVSRTILLGAGFTLLAACIAGGMGSTTLLLSYGIPALVVPAALLFPWRQTPAVRYFADVAMGIYASHPLVLIVLRHIYGDSLPAVIGAPVVFLAATALSKGIKRLPLGRRLV